MALDTVADGLLVLDKRTYFVHPQRVAACLPPDLIESLRNAERQFIPVSVFRWSQAAFDQQDLTSVCAAFSQTDDVWCSDFASGESTAFFV